MFNVDFWCQDLQQARLNLQRKLEMKELESGQKEAELTADLSALRAELEKHHNEGRGRRKDEGEQMTQLANHNQRLVEQLAEVRQTHQHKHDCHNADRQVSQLFISTSQAVTLEHTLRTELRSLREEMEDSSFNRNISLTQLESMQAEVICSETPDLSVSLV